MNKILESLGGYFLALPKPCAVNWPGVGNLQNENMLEKIVNAANWLTVSEFNGDNLVVFGGDVTSCELVDFKEKRVAVRRLYSDGGDISDILGTLIGSSEFKEKEDFENKSSDWIILDSALDYEQALENGNFLEWQLPLGAFDWITYYFEGETEAFIAHILR